MVKKKIDVVTREHRKINMQLEVFDLDIPIYLFNNYEKDKFIYFFEKSTSK